MADKKKWWVYMLQSFKLGVHPFDGVIYIGITTNVSRRFQQHNRGKGAKFTRGKSWRLIASNAYNSKSEALKVELKLKRLSKPKKLDAASVSPYTLCDPWTP